MKKSCFIHSQRQLSVPGRATVLKSLILSKLWHILRVFNLTQEKISSLQSLGSTFVNHHIYPKLSNNVIQLPCHQGGLGVLNIAAQQSAFQWRWLSPLLWSDPTSHSELTHCLSALRYTLNWFYATPNYPIYHWYLIFHFPIGGTVFGHPIAFLVTSNSTSLHSHSFNVGQMLQEHPGVRKLRVLDVDTQTIQLKLDLCSAFAKCPLISRFMANLIRNGQIPLETFLIIQCLSTPHHRPHSLLLRDLKLLHTI
jgi:hypothetical protein